jgi:hypothetical protein
MSRCSTENEDLTYSLVVTFRIAQVVVVNDGRVKHVARAAGDGPC